MSAASLGERVGWIELAAGITLAGLQLMIGAHAGGDLLSGACADTVRVRLLRPAKEILMHWFSIGVAIAAAVAIIAIGMMYLLVPRTATQSFGLPLPEDGANVAWWLRLKGTRDIVSGLIVVAVLVWGGPRMLGIVLLIEAIIPLGDMSLVLAAGGSKARAFGIHLLTAAIMIAGAVPLFAGTSP